MQSAPSDSRPLSRAGFVRRFGSFPIFGMIHLEALPGAPMFRGSLQEVIDRALEDAEALVEGGIRLAMVENFGDRPFFKSDVPAETIAAMASVITLVRHATPLRIGVNVLRNDGRSALAIAAAVGAEMIRVNVLTGSMLTDQGIIEGEAAGLMRMRERLAPEVAIFADHLVKHAVPLAAVDPLATALDLRLRGLADALIVTGKATGSAADPAALAQLRSGIDAPIVVGSGVTIQSIGAIRGMADGVIVGTGLKQGGEVEAPVDVERVRKLVAAVTATT